MSKLYRYNLFSPSNYVPQNGKYKSLLKIFFNEYNQINSRISFVSDFSV